MEYRREISLLHFLPNSSTNPTSSHSLAPNYPICVTVQTNTFPFVILRVTFATPTESPSSTPGLSLPLPPLSPPLRQVLTGPCCPGSPPTLTYSLPSRGNAELRGDLGRGCKTSGMWKTAEGKMEGPGPNPPSPNTHTR